MNPHDPNFWPAFLILGVPLIILAGGPFGWRAQTIMVATAFWNAAQGGVEVIREDEIPTR